jgi:hypothetical protein
MTKYCLIFLFSFTALFGVDLNLVNPSYDQGVLTTSEGGVITAPKFRVQAMQIRYDSSDGKSLLEAEKEIILEFGDYIFVGRRLVYDFNTNTGILYDGRTAVEPWFLGGEEIHLCADGSYYLENGFATTSENYKMDWKLETTSARLRRHQFLSAENVKFRFIALPVFWVPKLNLDLKCLFDPPVRLNFKIGGTRGSKIGAVYTLYSSKSWQTNVKLDYRLKSGFGGGFETFYTSPCKCSAFSSINYIAEDRTRYDDKKRTRYRLEGNWRTRLNKGKTTVDATWDKLSDQEMATDYDDKDLHLALAKPTQLYIRHQEPNWILTLLTRVRVNSFQTLKQELPTLTGSYRPFEIGSSGIISGGKFQASYLELEYTKNEDPGIHDYNSPRYEISQAFWRPYHFGPLCVTPEAGTTAIYYGNSQKQSGRWMVIGLFNVDMHTDLYRCFGSDKHVISPYLRYQYYTYPTTPPKDHFIFDIEDGWYRLNALRFGVLNNFYTKTNPCCVYRSFLLDVYAYAFFDTKTLRQTIPKGYIKSVYNFSQRMRHTNIIAWDFQHNILDHYNTLLEWTVNESIATAMEYRHRSRFDWRKVDKTNFIIDSYKSLEELEDSLLSDRRDTFLFHFYWQFHPTWALTFQSRNGWNRLEEPGYKEYQFAVLGTFRSSWHIKFAYKHRQNDDRFSVNFSVGLKRPCFDYNKCRVPCLEF